MRKYLIGSLLALGASLYAVPAYLEVDGQFGDFRQGAGIQVWAPIKTDGCSVLFAQGRAGHDRRYLTAWNLGLGYRSLYSNTIGYGINAFFDLSQSSFYRSYTQGGIGAELFGNCWLARVNGYIPGIRRTSEFTGVGPSFLDGNQIVNTDLFREEHSYGGFDVEVGYSIPFCLGEAWAYAAYYSFHTSHAKEVQGPRLRAEVRLFDPQILFGPQATIGGQWSYDRLHKNEGSVYLSLRFPLGCSKKQCCVRPICRRLYDTVYRNRSIWIERENTEETFVADNQILFIDAETGGSGTQVNPLSFPGGPVATGDEGDILFLLSNTGDITGPVNPLDDQQVWGFGDTDEALIPLGGGRTLLVTKINPAGIRPTVVSNTPAVNLMNRNTVSGIAINAFETAIRGTSVSDTTIDDVVVRSADGSGVSINGVSGDTSITNSMFSAFASGVLIVGAGGNILIADNVISGSALSGVLLQSDSVTNFSINRNDISSPNFCIDIETNPGAGDAVGLVNDNVLKGVFSSGVRYAASSGGGLTTTSHRNTVASDFAGGLTTGFQLEGNHGAGDTFTVLLQDNTVTSPTLNSVRYTNMASSAGTTNLTIIDHTSTGAVGTAYDIGYDAAATEQVCMTFQGNSDDGGAAVEIENPPNSGDITVFPGDMPSPVAASIAANNTLGGGTITVGANVTAGPPCPTP